MVAHIAAEGRALRRTPPHRSAAGRGGAAGRDGQISEGDRQRLRPACRSLHDIGYWDVIHSEVTPPPSASAAFSAASKTTREAGKLPFATGGSWPLCKSCHNGHFQALVTVRFGHPHLGGVGSTTVRATASGGGAAHAPLPHRRDGQRELLVLAQHGGGQEAHQGARAGAPGRQATATRSRHLSARRAGESATAYGLRVFPRANSAALGRSTKQT